MPTSARTKRPTRPPKPALTIRVPLISGVCRFCRCTYDNPCANPCSWVDRTQTLCSECWPLDEALKTAKGRQALVLFLQENWTDPIADARVHGKGRQGIR